MENFFSRLTLDIIGKAVFNYDFDSLTHDDPVIQARSLLHYLMTELIWASRQSCDQHTVWLWKVCNRMHVTFLIARLPLK